MKILLLGEFSALHHNLKDGLQEIGHEVIIAANGDGFKKIPADINFDSKLPSIAGQLERKFKTLNSLKVIKNYDVVQLINPFLLYKFFPGKWFLKKLKENNKKLFMLGAGSDAYYWKYGKQRLAYGPFSDHLKYDLKSTSIYLESEKAFKFNQDVLNMTDGLIPIMYEYDISYEGEKKKLPVIPIPINTNKIKYIENDPKEKITIFHGLNRYGFKGTRHVEQAFDFLRKKYPNDLNLIIKGEMPLNDYLELMKNTNIIIDQMYSYSLGVNGIYALAMGKVVMGGAEPESLNCLNLKSSPVINLEPNSQSIIDAVERILDNRRSIKEIGYQSRQFAEKIHCHRKVASQYVEAWNNIINHS